jgi:hypothetical protein
MMCDAILAAATIPGTLGPIILAVISVILGLKGVAGDGLPLSKDKILTGSTGKMVGWLVIVFGLLISAFLYVFLANN